MNKKVALSLLSATVISSMAASAFAAPNPGIYMGGDVDRYYSLTDLMNLNAQGMAKFNTDLGKAGSKNIVFVDFDKKGAFLEEIFKSDEGLEKVKKDLKQSDFEGVYTQVKTDGTDGATYDPRNDIDPEPAGELKVESVSAITKTELKVTFNKAVDAAAAENFKIPGLNVESASLDATKKVVTLKVSGAVAHKSYELTATGLKENGTTIADIKKTFEMPDATELFKLSVKTADPVLKADGASKTLVTFEVKDAAGNAVTAGDIEVAFSTTYGSLAEKRVTVQNGVATVLLTSEFLTSDVDANIIAQIVEAADKDLIGLKAETTVKLSPNPDDVVVGEKPVIGSAEANQADRVVVYFNKEVDLSYFIDQDGNFKSVIDFEVLSNVSNNGGGGVEVDVKGILPVPGNKKAVTLVLSKQDSDFPLVDNANVLVKLNDSTSGVSQESKAPMFKLTDARQPAALNVQVQDLRTLKVTFSEALDETSVTTYSNWTIDGVKLDNTNYDISLGDFVPNAQGGEDTRHVVTIKKKVGYFAAGQHSIQAAKIGDWAAKSDKLNVANTQTLDFTVIADENVPVATVTVQSPEQWLVDFNVAVDEDAVAAKAAFVLEVFNATTNTWGPVADADLADLKVTKVDDDKFLVETQKDWTKVYSTSTSGKNYFNDKYRLYVDKEKFTNAANGKQNAAMSLLLEDQMLTPDLTSPTIVDVTEVTAGTVFKATLSEPVKLPAGGDDKIETLAEKQTALPVPTAEFIAKDNSETITATVAATYADSYHKELTITPDKALKAGEWTLVIRSISDDIGNTAASINKTFTVKGEAPTADTFKVDWAFADVDADLVVEDKDSLDADKDHDYIFVTFTSAISTTGDYKNVLKTSNYTIDGKDLPLGSQIVAGIEGYTDATPDVVDSITIILPDGTLNDKNAPHVLNISKYLENSKGTKISGDLELKLAYNKSNGALVPAGGVTLGTTAETTPGVPADPGTKQVATIQVTTGATDAGNITIDGTTVALDADDDTPAEVAAKVAATAFANWDVTVDGDLLTFTAKAAGANATISIVDTDTTGATFGTQTNTTDGAASTPGTAEVATTTVTSGASVDATLTVNVNDGTIDQDVTVTVTAGQTAAQVADAIRTALAANGTINAAYDVTGAGADIVLTQKGTFSNVTVAVTLK